MANRTPSGVLSRVMRHGSRMLAVTLSASIILTAPGTTAWADSNSNTKTSTPKKSNPFQTAQTVSSLLNGTVNIISSLSGNGQGSNARVVATMMQNNTDKKPSDYQPLITAAPATTAVQEAAQLAAIQGKLVDNFAFLTWASKLQDTSARVANLIAGGAVSHPANLGVLPSDSTIASQITPFITSADQQAVALRDPTVQELLKANKMSWDQLESTLEQQRLDLQARSLKVGMTDLTNQIEDAANAVNDAENAADAKTNFEKAQQAYEASKFLAEKALESFQSQINAAPASARAELQKMFDDIKAQVEKSLAQAAEQLERARAALQKKQAAELANSLTASGATVAGAAASSGWGQSLSNLWNQVSDPINQAQFGWGSLKVVGGTALMIMGGGAGAVLQAIPFVGTATGSMVAALGVVTGGSIALSGLTDMAQVAKNAWNGGATPSQRLAYLKQMEAAQRRANAANENAAAADRRFGQAQSNLKRLGVDTNLLQLANDASDKADASFRNAVRSASNAKKLDNLYGDVNSAISNLSASITGLRNNSATIGTGFKGFDALMQSLYSSTTRGDQAYHEVLGQFVRSAAFDREASNYQKSFNNSLSSPAAKQAFQDYQNAYTNARQTADAATTANSEFTTAEALSNQNPLGDFGRMINNPEQGRVSALFGDLMGAAQAPYSIVGGGLGYVAGKVTGNVGLQLSSAGEIANNSLDRQFRTLFGWASGGEQVIQATMGQFPTTGNGAIDVARMTASGNGALAAWLQQQKEIQLNGLAGLNAVNYAQQGRNYAYQAANSAGYQALSNFGLMTAYKVAGAVPTIMGLGSAMSVATPFVAGGTSSLFGWFGASEATAATAGTMAAGAMGRAVAVPFIAEYAPKAMNAGIDVYMNGYRGLDAAQRENLFDVAGEALAFPMAQRAVGGLGLSGNREEAFRTNWNPNRSFVSNLAANTASVTAQYFAGTVQGVARFSAELAVGGVLTTTGMSGMSAAVMVAGGQNAFESRSAYTRTLETPSTALLQSRQIANILNRNSPRDLLVSVDAAPTSEAARYMNHEQVLDAAARRLSMSSEPGDRAFLNDVMQGNPVEVNGREVTPRQSSIDAAQRIAFEESRARMSVEDLNSLYKGNSVTLSNGRTIDGSRLNPTDVAREIQLAGGELTEAQKGLLEGAPQATKIPIAARIPVTPMDPDKRGEEMRDLLASAEPAHEVMTFERVLKVGRDLQADTTHPERFRKWLEDSKVAVTEEGFNELWNSKYGDRTVDQVQAELSQKVGRSTADYLASMEARVNSILERNQVDFSNVLTDQAAAARVDAARTEIMSEANPVDRAAMARLYAERLFKGATGNDFRAAQTAMVGLFGEGKNAGVDAGGGKTEAFIVDQGVSAMLGRELYRGEILAENAAASAKYASRESVLKLARGFGLEVVDGAKLQVSHQTKALIEAMHDPNALVVMDPVTRGHLSNEAATNPELRAALRESNVVGYDEVHQAATGRTASIIGGGEAPPSKTLVTRVNELFDTVQSRLSIDQKGKSEAVFETNNLEDFRARVEELNREGKVGIVKFGHDHIAISDALNAQLSALGFERGEIASVVRVLVTEKGARNGYEIGIGDQGRTVIFPVNEIGKIETSMISNDIAGQIAVARKHGLDPLTAVRVQETQMQTGLASIYENPSVRQVGASATIEGLNRLLQSRVGSKGVGVSTSRLELDRLLDANSTGLKQGGIPTLRIEGKDVTPDLSNASHRAELVRQMREGLSRGNVIIATEDTGLRDFFAEEFRMETVGRNGERLVIDGRTTDRAVNDIAASKDIGKVIIINPRAYTGVDFQMSADLWVMGAERLPEQELVQLLKRVNRPNPSNKGTRWEATRNLVPSSVEALDRSLKSVEELGRMVQRDGLDLDNVLQSQKARELVRRHLAGENLSLTEKLELNAFVKQAHVNSEAAKFAIQDTLRDRMIIQPLKRALMASPKGSIQEQLIKGTLNKVLNARGDYSPLTGTDYAADRTSTDFMRDTLRHVTQESESVLKHIEGQLSKSNPKNWTRSNAELNKWLAEQRRLQDTFDTAVKRYDEIEARPDLSISKAQSAEALLGVLKETNKLVLTGETAVTPKSSQVSIASADKAWDAIRVAVREARFASKGAMGLPSMSTTKEVMTALKGVDLSELGQDFRKSTLAALIVHDSPRELQAALGQFAADAAGSLSLPTTVLDTVKNLASGSTARGTAVVRQVVNSIQTRVPHVTPELVRSLAYVAGSSKTDSQVALTRLQALSTQPQSSGVVAAALTKQTISNVAGDPSAAQKLQEIRQRAVSAPQEADDFTIKRSNSDTKAPVIVTVSAPSQSSIDRVSDLRDTARAGTPVVVALAPAAAQNADFVSKMKLQMRLANRQGGDFYLTQPDGSAVKIGVAGGRNVAANKISGSASNDTTKVPGYVTEAARTVRPGAAISEAQAVQYFGASAIAGLSSISLLSLPVLPVIATVAAIGGMLYYASRPASFAPVALTPVTGASFFEQFRAFTRQPAFKVAAFVPAFVLVAGIASAEANPLAALGTAVVKAAGGLMAPAGLLAGGAVVVAALGGGWLWYNHRKSQDLPILPKHFEEFRVTA